MNITLNGEKKEIAGLTNMGELLERIGFGGKPVVVEQNQRALFPREIPTSPVSDGDVIEIVQVTAGG